MNFKHLALLSLTFASNCLTATVTEEQELKQLTERWQADPTLKIRFDKFMKEHVACLETGPNNCWNPLIWQFYKMLPEAMSNAAIKAIRCRIYNPGQLKIKSWDIKDCLDKIKNVVQQTKPIIFIVYDRETQKFIYEVNPSALVLVSHFATTEEDLLLYREFVKLGLLKNDL